MGQQFGRRSWAEPWKIKVVEPLFRIGGADRERARGGEEDHESGPDHNAGDRLSCAHAAPRCNCGTECFCLKNTGALARGWPPDPN